MRETNSELASAGRAAHAPESRVATPGPPTRCAAARAASGVAAGTAQRLAPTRTVVAPARTVRGANSTCVRPATMSETRGAVAAGEDAAGTRTAAASAVAAARRTRLRPPDPRGLRLGLDRPGAAGEEDHLAHLRGAQAQVPLAVGLRAQPATVGIHRRPVLREDETDGRVADDGEGQQAPAARGDGHADPERRQRVGGVLLEQQDVVAAADLGAADPHLGLLVVDPEREVVRAGGMLAADRRD